METLVADPGTLAVDMQTGNVVLKTNTTGVHIAWTLKQAIEFHKSFGEVLEAAKKLVAEKG